MWLTRRDRGARAPIGRVLVGLIMVGWVLVGVVLAGFAGPAAAQSPLAFPLGLSGFDPVSYFLPGGPQAGLARFEVSGRNRTWRFSRAANRAAFLRDPDAYTPRLGGYDAAGILDGRLVDADPLVFAVVGDRLYLFRDAARRARILADPGLAEQAEGLWPGLRRITDGGPE